MKKLKINLKDCLIYFLIIPFVYPKGFSEYFHIYKTFFTIWLYISIIIIYLICIVECIKFKKKIYNYTFLGSFILYFLVLFVITLFCRNTFTDTLQKIFVPPALCFLCYKYFTSSPYRLIKITNNVLSLLFFLNLTFFNPLFCRNYFAPITNHLTFLGHVQTGAQLGMLLIILSYIEYKYFNKCRSKFIRQILLSFGTMLLSFTSASYISIILIVIFFIIYKFKLYDLLNINSIIYIIIYLLINFVMLFYIKNNVSAFEIFGFSLNGRGFIWKEAMNTISNNFIYGYGSHGVLIKVFWSAWTGDGLGMNYMHNQILQVLLDGGMILFIPFIFLLCSSFNSVNKVKDRKNRYWLTCFFLVNLLVMTFESTMEYFYIFYIFCIYAYMPYIVKLRGNN